MYIKCILILYTRLLKKENLIRGIPGRGDGNGIIKTLSDHRRHKTKSLSPKCKLLFGGGIFSAQQFNIPIKGGEKSLCYNSN